MGSSVLYFRSLIGLISEGLIIFGLISLFDVYKFYNHFIYYYFFIPLIYIFNFYTKNKIQNLGKESPVRRSLK